MPLRLADHWIWDFWFAQEGDDVHVFYLQAPRALGDPGARHDHATIGHAVSRDLRSWRLLPDALGPGAPGAFDDLATWTGSVVRHDGRWHLFYTGASRSERAAVQRVGLATSDDLMTWEKHGVVSEAGPAWYATRSGGSAVEAWRDPWVEWDDDTERFHMLVCARANHGPADARGVIGHASSRELRSWVAAPPLSRPGEFSQLEVPQLVHLGGAWRILFSATQADHGAERLGRAGVVAVCGTHYLTSDAKFGDYVVDGDAFLVGDPVGRHYAGRLLHHRGAWTFLAWRMHDEHGGFVGELSDPMAVDVGPDGTLAVRVPGAGRP
jgi:beta-fructofuranosidase